MHKTYAEKAEMAVAMFYRQDKRVSLKEICLMLDVPLHLALTVLEEYNT
jgi:hypothetical protein